MRINTKDKNDFDKLISEYTKNTLVNSMKNYVQHSDISTYEHCVSVAEYSFIINRKLNLKADEKVLVTSALLHDFYLYDWHIKSNNSKHHAKKHSFTAAKNAKDEFDVDYKIQRAIETHMWPINITQVPSSKEAWIICFVDKFCALKETISRF